jgi:ribosome-associated protein
MNAPVGGDLVVSRELTVPATEIEVRVSTSRGAGGQHANRSLTRVTVSFDATHSPSLTDEQRALVVERLGPVVRASAEDERSQVRNRQLALDRLAGRLRDALRRDPPRRPTRPSRGADERRLAEKRRQSERKSSRRSDPDW